MFSQKERERGPKGPLTKHGRKILIKLKSFLEKPETKGFWFQYSSQSYKIELGVTFKTILIWNYITYTNKTRYEKSIMRLVSTEEEKFLYDIMKKDHKVIYGNYYYNNKPLYVSNWIAIGNSDIYSSEFRIMV